MTPEKQDKILDGILLFQGMEIKIIMFVIKLGVRLVVLSIMKVKSR